MVSPADTARAAVADLYGNRLRLRVCGLLRANDRLLLVRHRGVGPTGVLWSPPGGGLEFGETMVQGLQREFREETGLDVAVGPLLGVFEYLQAPLHAIELVFETYQTGGHLRLGTDPEMAGGEQIITDICLLTFADIQAIPAPERHRVFGQVASLDALFTHTNILNSFYG